ncbi:MAG: 16S rRNA (cytidine(1402)-2'-O)-methyltransferase [bacterium]
MSGRLYVVATPLGNIRDITLRAKDVLSDVDEWIVEDSRRAAKLRDNLGLPKKPMNRYYDENETRRTPELLQKLKQGLEMALVSDAGTPVIADPGYELINRSRSEGIEVHPVPGVSAPVAALSVSGFPASEFLFIGFFPRTQPKRREKLLEVKYYQGTVVFFEAPHRLEETLKTIRTYLGDRQLFVGREMTKQYEQYRTGTADELLDVFQDEQRKGEFTILLHPAEEESVEPEQFLEELLKKGMKLSEAAKIAGTFSDRKRSDLYQVGLDVQDKLESESP